MLRQSDLDKHGIDDYVLSVLSDRHCAYKQVILVSIIREVLYLCYVNRCEANITNALACLYNDNNYNFVDTHVEDFDFVDSELGKITHLMEKALIDNKTRAYGNADFVPIVLADYLYRKYQERHGVALRLSNQQKYIIDVLNESVRRDGRIQSKGVQLLNSNTFPLLGGLLIGNGYVSKLELKIDFRISECTCKLWFADVDTTVILSNDIYPEVFDSKISLLQYVKSYVDAAITDDRVHNGILTVEVQNDYKETKVLGCSI